MTQAQPYLQNRLEQTNKTDLTSQPLFNDFPVLFLEVMDQAPSVEYTEQNSPTKQTEQPIPLKKPFTPSETNNFEHSHGTPPPSKKPYEMKKDPAFLSSPTYPPILPCKPSFFANRDDHLVQLLYHDSLHCTCILQIKPSTI